jgi:hypothetical protein
VPLGFRLAIGRCDCTKPYRDPVTAKACKAIDIRLEGWRTRLPADLAAVPNEVYEDEEVEGHGITFGTHKHALPTGDTLVVVQALVHTWARPTFLSLGAVGRMYAEGLLVTPRGTVQRAPDQVMWLFR